MMSYARILLQFQVDIQRTNILLMGIVRMEIIGWPVFIVLNLYSAVLNLCSALKYNMLYRLPGNVRVNLLNTLLNTLTWLSRLLNILLKARPSGLLSTILCILP
ncbi:MAG: hypothetical protein AB1847_00750 [bacterium]